MREEALDRDPDRARNEDGHDQEHRGVDERVAAAKQLLTGQGLKPADIIKAAFHATALPGLLQAYQSDMQAKDGEISKLQKQVEALTAAQPGKGGSTATAAATGETSGKRAEINKGQTPMEASASFMKSVWETTD
jgi:hypothetical protein